MTATNPVPDLQVETHLAHGGFVLLLAMTTLFGLAFSTYFLLPKYLAVELGADPIAIGGVSTIFWLAAVAAVPFAGSRVDRHGRRLYAGIGALLLAGASAGFVWVQDIGPLIWSLRVIQGLGFTLFYVSAATLVADLSPPARLGQALGIFGAVMIFTNAAGPAFAEWASVKTSWPTVFALTAVSALLAALGSRFVPEPSRQHRAGPDTTLLRVLRLPGMAPVMIASAMTGWIFGTLFTFYQPWALLQGITRVSDYLVAYAAAAVAVRVLAGGLADRLGRLLVVRMMALLYLLAPISVIALDTIGLAVAGALLGVAQGIYYPALNAIAIERASAAERGKVMAAYNGAFNLGMSAAGLALGHLVAASGYLPIFWLAVLASVGTFVILARTREH